MFPRAPRFRATRDNGVPGPNAYDPTEQEAHYKRGAMFERDARFRSPSRANDGSEEGGVASYDRPSSVASTSKVKLDARIPALEKDKAKLFTRIKVLEEQLSVATTETTTLQREKKQLQTEVRLYAQKVERNQAQQQAQAKSQSLRSDNMVQLKERIKLLEARESEQKAQVEKLNVFATRSEEEKCAANERAEGLRKRLEKGDGETMSLLENVRSLTHELEEVRLQKHSLEQSQAVHKASLKDFQGHREKSEQEYQRRIECLSEANCNLSYENRCSDEELKTLRSQNKALVAVALDMAQRDRKSQNALAEASLSRKVDLIHFRRLRSALRERDGSIDSLQTQLRAKMEVGSGGEEIGDAEPVLMQDAHALGVHMTDIDKENTGEAHQIRLEEAAVQASFNALQIAQNEVDLAWKDCIIERLQGEVKNSNAQQRAMSLERQSQADLQSALDKSRKELSHVEEAYEAGVLEVMQAHEKIEQMHAHANRSKAALDTMTDQLQKLDGVQIKLKNARLREDALLRDKQELLEDLSRSSNFESAYYGIRAEAHKLMTRLSAREVQAEELASLNAVLASNTNPHQKINYLERIRRQLDETRLHLREMEEERNGLHRRCRDLQAQLDVFTRVDLASRSTNVGTALGLEHSSPLSAASPPMPLDEREAARRAWQSRPRTRFTRVTRNGELELETSTAMTQHKPLRERPSRGTLSDKSNTTNSAMHRSLNDTPNVSASYDDSGEVTGLGLDVGDGTTTFEAPKRRILRARRSDTALGSRTSPVATLPSFDALAWDLDKDHLSPPMPVQSDAFTPGRSASASPRRSALMLEGELTLQDLTGL